MSDDYFEEYFGETEDLSRWPEAFIVLAEATSLARNDLEQWEVDSIYFPWQWSQHNLGD